MNRLLIVGFGDIARRAAARLERRFEVTPVARRYGLDLDRPESLAIEDTDALMHCAPPPAEGETDTRTANLLTALEKCRILPARMVYVSTSGVYGDCAVALVVLRAPGIYAADRLPLERLRAATPILRAEDDVHTNHIHAEDLAAIVCRALEHDAPAGVYNASDDTQMKMGDWLDLVAAVHGLPRPPRIARAEAREMLPAILLSFMNESRRLDNRRLKEQLGVRLRYPTVEEGLRNEHALGMDQSA